MDIRKLQRAIVDGLEDVKAQHIAVFNTEHLSSMFERVIVASGTSNRQTKALAASVRDRVRGGGFPILSTEGEDNGEWIIVDCGAAVVHIMQPAIRDYYHLEEIWGGKAVKMKLGEVNTKLVKASEPEPAARKKAKPAGAPVAAKAPGRPAGSRAAARAVKRSDAQELAEKKSTNRTAAFKRVAAKSPARKAAPAGAGARAAAKSASAPKPAAKTKTIVVKPPAKKTAAKAAPARKAAAKKPATKKPAAKKATRRA
ncbi:MAG: ribosome silencing factor [Leptothrix sp. (in: Bacteria)]|nr:ribosome silencing factor [Leptothrix sp. (in: b-proteobacteria)]